MSTLKNWWDAGRYLRLDGHRYFTRDVGSGDALVFLHGFPTSSHDWSDVIEDMSVDHRCITFDYLGFGASDKPTGVSYTAAAQTERCIRLLELIGVEKATVVGHDLGGILLQRLVHGAVRKEIDLRLQGAVFLNSSVFADLYRPTPVQLALVDPTHGRQVAAAVTGDGFRASMADMFAARPASRERLDDMWAAVSRDDGQLLWPDQLVYMAERARWGDAWISSMRLADVPLSFVYGLADPISGEPIITRAGVDLPASRRVGLDGIGHYPQIEAAADVVAALRKLLRRGV